jgi:ornithine cyclodeaminase/alanine dehydrogenase-like protein (mu-crystallin family)
MLVLSAADVEQALPMTECIDAMARALADLDRGLAEMPLRSAYRPPGSPGTAMAWMPARRNDAQAAAAAKVLCLVPGNRARGLDAHQGLVVLFDGATGEPQAALNAAAVTAIRTAAVSALATRELARIDAVTLAVIGAGVQAEAHLAAMPLVRRIKTVVIASREPQSASALAERAGAAASYQVRAESSVEAAVRGADIVVTATTASSPVIDVSWLEPGSHINAVGTGFEIDAAALAAAELLTDRRESLTAEARDYRAAVERGLVGPQACPAELGEVICGRSPGRSSASAITLFRSLGLACEDLYAAQHAVSRARSLGLGSEVPI